MFESLFGLNGKGGRFVNQPMKQLMGRLLICLLVCAFWGGSAAIAETVKPQTPKILNGQKITDSKSPVVLITGRDSAGEGYLCSGAVIGTRFILTAGHCVDGKVSNLRVTAGSRRFTVTRATVHPRYSLTGTADSQDASFDFAILQIRGTVSTRIAGLLKSKTLKSGQTVFIYGYGQDERSTSGTLRGGRVIVRDISTEGFTFNYNGNGQSGSCFGDSGGPAVFAFVDRAGKATYAIAGVASLLVTPSANPCGAGSTSFYGSVQNPEVQRFIRGVVRKASFL